MSSNKNNDAVNVAGVLVEVLGLGVLIIGPSGSGKSDLALALINAGHRLAADDVVEVSDDVEGCIGRAPSRLAGKLYVRGIGVIDVASAMGAEAVASSVRIDMVVDLDRESDDAESYVISSSSSVPRFRFAADRANLPLLVEAAVKFHRSGGRGREESFFELHDQLVGGGGERLAGSADSRM